MIPPAPYSGWRRARAGASVLKAGASRGGAEVRRVVERYLEICRDEGVDDPALHARWIAAFGPNEVTRAGWELLAEISPAKLPG